MFIKPVGGIPRSLRIPVVGPAYAGRGVEQGDEILGWRASIPVRGALRADRFFSMTVTGDSLECHDIQDGDYLIARLTRQASCGDLVIAHTSEGRIAKYLQLCADTEKVTLVGANPKYEDLQLYKEDVRIIGVVWRVERDLILDGHEVIEVVNEYGDSRRHDRYQFM